MFTYIPVLLGVLGLFFIWNIPSYAEVKRTKIVVPKVVRTVPPKAKAVVKQRSKNSIVHTKILDSNLIDPDKMSF